MSFLSSNASISEWRSRLALSSPIVSSRAFRAVSSLRGQEEVATLRSSWQCTAKFNFYAPFQITNFVLIVKGIEILNILRKSSCSLLQSRLSQVVKLLKSCENCRISFTFQYSRRFRENCGRISWCCNPCWFLWEANSFDMVDILETEISISFICTISDEV